MKKDKKVNKRNKNVDFLYEIGSLKNTKRAWAQVLGNGVANNIEHSFRVIMLALIIAREEGVKNEEKIMKMALFHDLCESRSMDIAFMHRAYVDRHEEKAATDQLTGTVFEKDILDLLHEYKERKTIESKIVKDADHLDIDLELQELVSMGNASAKHYATTNRPNVAKKLVTKTAQRMWKEIYKVEPFEFQNHLTNGWVADKKFGK